MKYLNIVLILTTFSVACNTSKKATTNKEKIVAIEKVTTNISAIIDEKEIIEVKDILAAEKETKKVSDNFKETEKTIEKVKEVIAIKNTTTETSGAIKKTKNHTEKNKEVIATKTPIETVVNPEKTAPIIASISKKVFNHDLWNNLLQKHVSNKGNVSYKGFKNDRTKLNEYIANLSNNVPNATATKKDKLAYWINAYNALTVDLILRNYPIKSIKDIKKPWDQKLWTLGGELYDLNEIEHGILRKMNEPRIHFAIVCASFSCPQLSNKAYTGNTIETQLTKATKDFLNDPLRNNLSKDDIKISKIFKWFAKDFKTKGSIIDFMNKYTSVNIDSNADSNFKDYNWNLNE